MPIQNDSIQKLQEAQEKVRLQLFLFFHQAEKEDEYWQDKNAEAQQLYDDLLSREQALKGQQKKQEEALDLLATADEKARQSLVKINIMLMLARALIIFRDLTNIFIATAESMMGLAVAFGGFFIRGILALWELSKLLADKITGKNTIKQSKTRFVVSILTLGAVIVSALIVGGVIIVASTIAPYIVPLIMFVVAGFGIYKEHYILKQMQKGLAHKKARETQLSTQLNERICDAIVTDPEISALYQAIKHNESLLTQKNVEDRAKINAEIQEQRLLLVKKLYDVPGIYTCCMELREVQMQIRELEINIHSMQNKRKAMIGAMVGAALAMTGLALTLVSGPIGLAFALAGVLLTAHYANVIRKQDKFTSDAQKKLAAEKKQDLPALAVLDTLETRSFELEKNGNIAVYRLEQETLAEERKKALNKAEIIHKEVTDNFEQEAQKIKEEHTVWVEHELFGEHVPNTLQNQRNRDFLKSHERTLETHHEQTPGAPANEKIFNSQVTPSPDEEEGEGEGLRKTQ